MSKFLVKSVETQEPDIALNNKPVDQTTNEDSTCSSTPQYDAIILERVP